MRMTKHEMKENELVEYFYIIRDFFKKNWEKISVSLLIVGVLIFVAVIAALTTNKMNNSAAAEFSQGLYYYQNTQADAPDRYAQAKAIFKGIIDKYPRSSSKSEAEFYLASSHFGLGEYDDATKIFEKTSKIFGGKQLGMYSLQGLGKCYESKGNLEEALKFYQEAIKKYPKNFYVGNLMLDVGRCQNKLGKTSEAVQTYEKILSAYPETTWARESKLRLNLLKG